MLPPPWLSCFLILTLSFSFITSQLKQFLDTEVLFHDEIKQQDSAKNPNEFPAFKPIHTAVQKLYETLTCSLRQHWLVKVFLVAESDGKQKGSCCGYSLWACLRDVNLIIKKKHFLHVIALWIVHCIMFSRYDWIAFTCSVIYTGSCCFCFCFVRYKMLRTRGYKCVTMVVCFVKTQVIFLHQTTWNVTCMYL